MVFIKNKEDFTCEHCGTDVMGTGYTNHCPECLWSKHVDIDPGDRRATCGGMMEPVSYENIKGDDRVVHRCLACRHKKANRISPDDKIDAILQLSPP